MIKHLFLTLIAMLTLSCASTQPQSSNVVGMQMSQSQYENLIDKHTQRAQKYDGFYNKFEVFATFLNTEVQTAILQRRSDVYQWDMTQAQKEREKMFQENSTETRFAVSFFVPSARLNDLHKGASIWKLYIETNGQRYEGKATRRNGKLEDLQAIYPYHNRWSIPYDVVFKVPLSAVEQSPVKFIITSSQGSATFDYLP
jgi:hypothetical protein